MTLRLVIPFALFFLATSAVAQPQLEAQYRDQGVQIARGVWHHPMIALDAICEFVEVHRAGPEANETNETAETRIG